MEKILSTKKFMNWLDPWALVACLLFVLWSFPQQLLAAAQIEVSPMLQEVALSNGQDAEATITLTNATSTKQSFQLKTYDFGNLDESGGVAFLGADRELEKNYALASWLVLDTPSIVLEPGAEALVKVTVRNDAALAPGGHYGAIIFETDHKSDPTAQNFIAVNQMLASLLLVKKTEGMIETMDLIDVQSTRAWRKPPSFLLTFQNTGNVHVVPRGRVQMSDSLGRVVAQGVINEASTYLLPESKRVYWVKPFWLQSAWLPGKYTYRFEYRFDGSEETREFTGELMLFPLQFWMHLGGMGLLAAGWIGYRHWRKRSVNV